MKKYSFPTIGAAVIAAGCGVFHPVKDPDALAMNVPLEQAAPKKNETRESLKENNLLMEEVKIMAAIRQELSSGCVELDKNNFLGQCTGKIFQNNSKDDPDGDQYRQLRNRCLFLMLECEKTNRNIIGPVR